MLRLTKGMPCFLRTGAGLLTCLPNRASTKCIAVSQDGEKHQISQGGGDAPVWSRDGKELFYWDLEAKRLVAVRISTQPAFAWSKPLGIDHIQQRPTWRQYDVMPDGKRFLVVVPGATPPIRQINIVLNWFEDLKQRVPAR